jgi:hypothetical protein
MQLVYEKEKRLRMMMKMHGLGDVAYWLVMYSWFWMLYVAYMLIFVIFGSIIKLNMFTRNSYGEQGDLDKGLLPFTWSLFSCSQELLWFACACRNVDVC